LKIGKWILIFAVKGIRPRADARGRMPLADRVIGGYLIEYKLNAVSILKNISAYGFWKNQHHCLQNRDQ
jgi:hypothetical protein